jgi:heptosyltransferase-1
MGDVLHALPAATALRQLHPDWQIGWAIEPHWSPLLRAHVGMQTVVDRIHPVPARLWKQHPFSLDTLRSILQLRRELREQKYDYIVDVQGTVRSAVIGWLAGAQDFTGPQSPRESPAKILYRRKASPQRPHMVEQAAEILSAALQEKIVPAAVDFMRDPEAEVWCDALLSFYAGKKIAVIAPGAGWGAKRWPAERYGALAAALDGRGCAVFINAGVNKQEQKLAADVVAASGNRAQTVSTTLEQMIALLRRTALFAGGDTGPLHLAAALHCNVLGIYGPTDPARNGPWATRSIVLRHAESRRDHARHEAPEAGLLQITVEEAIAAADRLLQETGE